MLRKIDSGLQSSICPSLHKKARIIRQTERQRFILDAPPDTPNVLGDPKGTPGFQIAVKFYR